MNHRIKLSIYFITIICCSFLMSCSEDYVSILYNSKYVDEHEVILDDTIKLKNPNYTTFSKMFVRKGKHKIKIDGQSTFEFEATKDGDIVNLAAEEFVIYPIRFQLGNDTNISSFGLPNRLIIDSFLIVSAEFLGTSIFKMKKSDLLEINNGNMHTELLKHSSDQYYISKTWDYDMMSESPTEIVEEVSENTKNMTTFRRRILPATEFLKLAREMQLDYVALPLSSFKD